MQDIAAGAISVRQRASLPSPNSPGLKIGDITIVGSPPTGIYQLAWSGSARAWEPIGGGATTQSAYRFLFDEGVPQSGNVYGDFSQLMAVIASLPDRSLPEVIFVKDATIPLAGMPAGGWDMKMGTWSSYTTATGVVKVTIPDGVSIDNLADISNGLLVECAPTSDYGVFKFSESAGLPWVFIVSFGAALRNATPSNNALIVPTAADFVVLATALASFAAVAPSTGPLVRGAGGTIIGSQNETGVYGWLPNDWVDGVGTLIYQNSAGANEPTLSAWAGAVFSFDAPASRTVIFRPGAMTNGNVYGTWQEAVKAVERADGASSLFVDDSSGPAVADVDLNGHGLLCIYSANPLLPVTLTIADGTVLSNIRKIGGSLVVFAEPSALSPLAFAGTKELAIEDAAVLRLGLAASVPMASVPTGAKISTARFGRIQSMNPAIAALSIIPGSTISYRSIDQEQGVPAADNAFSGVVGDTIDYQTDASGFDFVSANPLFTGALNEQLNDVSTYVGYTAGNPADWVPPLPSTTKEAIDRIAAEVAILKGGPIA